MRIRKGLDFHQVGFFFNQMLFDLGKVYDKLGRYSEAYAAYEQIRPNKGLKISSLTAIWALPSKKKLERTVAIQSEGNEGTK